MTSRVRCFLAGAAFLFLLGAARAAAAEPAGVGRYLTFQYDLYGKAPGDLVREGCIRGVKSAIGRMYFGDSMLRGRSLLDAYVERHWERLIARRKITASEVRGGRRFVALEVVVDNEKIRADLTQKKFLYRPAFRPLFYIFMEETYDGKATAAVGRRRLLEMIDERQYRYLWESGSDKAGVPVAEKEEVAVAPPLPEQDATASARALGAACDEAQRNEVEVVIAGAIRTRTTRTGKLYYDDYTFVETRCVLKVIRADTGEVIASGETVTSAGHMEAAKAVAAATLAAVNEIGPGLLDEYFKQWGKMILRKADVRILITGVDAEGLGLFRQVLQGAVPGAEVYTRAVYADVAVVTVSLGGKVKELGRALRDTFYPAFRMTQGAPGEMILEVLAKKPPA